MQSLLINMIFAASLLGCSGPTNQSKEIPASQKSASIADESRDKPCDFSLYSPVRIKQFNPKSTLRRVQPQYPPEAVQTGIQGRVVVKALVNEKGLVERVCSTEGEQRLRKAAEEAALQWKFKPGYGLAFIRPKTEKNPKNFAEVYIVFEFKLDKTGPKSTAVARP